uniref:Uncharacterized protein n=1 Tax=Magnetococcus massalia (strain MO-1) TaxID=451514 RepID=A0A1S7LEX0_MAGMO|nr:conserved protein of unknown function[Include ArsC family domain] [Candidatus Magnetococcus massalia]
MNNRLQKAMLESSGHTLEPRDLLAEIWKPVTLRAFFGNKPVVDWFNRSAPKVKQGEVDPSSLDEATALQMMVAEPLLIRRPLMQCGSERRAGFEPEEVDAWVGLKKASPESPGSSSTVSLELCPVDHADANCAVRVTG